MSDTWVEDPVFRLRHRFWRAGDVQHVETVIAPGGGVTPHVHPAMEERFVVHEGRCQFLAGRRWTEAGPGDEVLVPAGTRHAFRNRGAVATRAPCSGFVDVISLCASAGAAISATAAPGSRAGVHLILR